MLAIRRIMPTLTIRITSNEANATGIITTAAGTGAAGFSGDGGGATSAQLSFAVAVAVDAFGNLFIADTGNNRIRRVDAATRTISTIVGNGTLGFAGDGGPATSAQLAEPDGVTIDATGALLIADFFNNRIRRVPGGTRPSAIVDGAGFLPLSRHNEFSKQANSRGIMPLFREPPRGNAGERNVERLSDGRVSGISLNSKTRSFWPSNPCLPQQADSLTVARWKCGLMSNAFQPRTVGIRIGNWQRPAGPGNGLWFGDKFGVPASQFR